LNSNLGNSYISGGYLVCPSDFVIRKVNVSIVAQTAKLSRHSANLGGGFGSSIFQHLLNVNVGWGK
jgi:hypothetical protein